MAWVSEDWDKLGSFLSSGLGAYGSERQRRQENRWRQEKMDLDSQRAEAYIATLNEQMESSQARRTADTRAAERLRTPMGEAWGGGPEDVPLGEMGGYQSYQDSLRRGEAVDRGQEPVSEAVQKLFPGLPLEGLTQDDFHAIISMLRDQLHDDRKASFDRAKTDASAKGGVSAAMLGQILKVKELAREQALMHFAQQKPEIMDAVESARDELTGNFNWTQIARALGEEGWQKLETSAQYLADEQLLSVGTITKGMRRRYAERFPEEADVITEETGEAEGQEEKTTKKRKDTVSIGEDEERPFTTAERKAYYLAEHPGLQNPAMAGLRADPQAIDVLALKELYSGKPATGFSALETMDRKNLDPSRQWAGWTGDIREEQARQVQAARQKELQRFRGRPRQRNVPQR